MADNKNRATVPPLASCLLPFDYPLARRDETIVDNFFGKKLADPYRWLEDPDKEETKEYVAKLNAFSAPYLQSCPVRDRIEKTLTDLWNYEKFSGMRKHGSRYFYKYNSGLQNQDVLYMKENLQDEGKMFLDPNKLSSDGTVALTALSFSHDGSLLAYGISERGSDWVTVNFMKVPSQEQLPDKLIKLRYTSLCWTIDNKGIFYTMFPEHKSETIGTSTVKNEYHKLFYHVLGTNQNEDVLCFDFPEDPNYVIGCEVTEDGQYCVCTVERGCEDKDLLYYCDLTAIGNNIKTLLNMVPLIDIFEAEFKFISHDGLFFTIQTDYEAPMFKIIRIDINHPSKEHWKTVVAEAAKDVLLWAVRVNHNQMVVCYLKDVKNVLQVRDFSSGQLLFTLLLEVGSVSHFFGREMESEIFYCCESFVVPRSTYRVDLASDNPNPELLWQTKLPGIDPSNFETEQVFYNSKDGTKIPMFIIHLNGAPKSPDCPAMLYGYGGFKIPLVPVFDVVPFIMVNEFGGIYAVANIRGGSEYGQKWHKAGMKENKQNVFDDFIAAAEFLVNNNYTSCEKLTISGASNGGLLVCACAIQRPDLFGCVICKVGVLDMLRYHRFTIGEAWVPEYGSAEEAESFEYLIKYSPLHTFRCLPYSQQYPAMLFLTADHDDRVVPSHSLKFIANAYYTLKKCTSQRNPILICIETNAGHGVGKPTQKLIKEWIDIYAFICRALNLELDSSFKQRHARNFSYQC